MIQGRESVLGDSDDGDVEDTHSILRLSKSNGSRAENFVMIPIEKIGFIVIKQEIEVESNEKS